MPGHEDEVQLIIGSENQPLLNISDCFVYPAGSEGEFNVPRAPISIGFEPRAKLPALAITDESQFIPFGKEAPIGEPLGFLKVGLPDGRVGALLVYAVTEATN